MQFQGTAPYIRYDLLYCSDTDIGRQVSHLGFATVQDDIVQQSAHSGGSRGLSPLSLFTIYRHVDDKSPPAFTAEWRSDPRSRL